ncbi:hypothetical protein Vretimale_3738 [Volvox reticuliferus]|uniref:HMG box domain-containing protein n=1 Tax=Volvox reticuliferus TaxID=1737510 RepID=A0A8J4C3F1_9CHLO|nr:hypothetical protein Vretifemale_1362 [Volvox reticuliferus]GIL98351.1 hypothetical protein Vretimale_3738 [Volvox reticuliferus]
MSSYGGNSYPGRGQRGSYGTGPASGRATGTGRKPVAFCTCCEAKLSPDELLMSSQTEGRCVACQQFVEAQSACRVCHLPWSSSNETQLVPCDACGFYMHDNCVKKGALQAKSGGRVYTYCPHCPPTLPTTTAAGRDAGAASRGASSERTRQNAAGSLSLSLSSGTAVGLTGKRSPSAGGGRGGGGGAVANGGGCGDLASAAALAAAVLPPAPPQSAALQQVAALLQGQLRMLQTQQQTLLRQYDQQLREVIPPPPPTAYSLFQLDMFRVYQEEGFEIDPLELQPIINNAWLQLTPEERTGYDSRASQEMLSWTANAQLYVQLYHEYETLAGHVGSAPDTTLLPKSLQSMLQAARQVARLGGGGTLPASGPGSGRGPGRPPGSGNGTAAAPAAAAAGRGGAGSGASAAGYGSGGGGGRGVKRSAMDTLAGASALMGMNMGPGSRGVVADEEDDDDDEDYEAEGAQQGAKRSRRVTSPAGAAAAPSSRPQPRNTRLPADKLPTSIADLPAQLNVSCNDVAGTFIMDGIKVLCHCKECRELPKSQREFHPTHWEQHCGAGTAKKWKASVKIEPGGAPEVPPGGNPMQIGKWFDMLGVEFRPAKTTGGPPVLDFTGATIRRMEAEGAAAGAGSGGGPQPQQQASQPPEQQQQQQPQQQQRPSPPASSSPSPMYQQVLLQQPQPPLAAPLPPRPARGMQSMQSASGSIPPLGGGGGRRGGGGGGDDVVTSAANSGPAGGAGAKPPRPVSDEREGNGDAVYCRVASTRVATQPRRGGGRDGGEEGESSSRGSASDTLGHTATA